jgi:hypothetical protein
MAEINIEKMAQNVAKKAIQELRDNGVFVSRWIPVSERLPDTDDKVLCWYEYYHWSRGKVLPEYGLGRYFKETKAWFGEVAHGVDVRVIAWMPLPKPYKAESEKE